MTDRLGEALPGCGHWKDADFARSWSLRLMDEDADWRMVCEAVIDTASGQRYCMDEGPRLEPAEIEGWFAAARSWHTLTTAQHASNWFTVTCCAGQHEVRIAGELVAWCRFHRAAGDADKDCWGAGLDGQDSCYPAPALIVLDALTVTTSPEEHGPNTPSS